MGIFSISTKGIILRDMIFRSVFPRGAHTQSGLIRLGTDGAKGILETALGMPLFECVILGGRQPTLDFPHRSRPSTFVCRWALNLNVSSFTPQNSFDRDVENPSLGPSG
jgi:hypothetical protein